MRGCINVCTGSARKKDSLEEGRDASLSRGSANNREAGVWGKPCIGGFAVHGVFPGRCPYCGVTAPGRCQRPAMRWLGAIRQGFERDRRRTCTHADRRPRHHHHRAGHATGLRHHQVAADASQQTTAWSRFHQRRWPGSPHRPVTAGSRPPGRPPGGSRHRPPPSHSSRASSVRQDTYTSSAVRENCSRSRLRF